MESIVEDVEDERQYEGSPANSQSCEDSGGWDGMGISIIVNHSDGLSRCCHHQGHHCQTDRINDKSFEKYLMLGPDLKSDHNGVVTQKLHKL